MWHKWREENMEKKKEEKKNGERKDAFKTDRENKK